MHVIKKGMRKLENGACLLLSFLFNRHVAAWFRRMHAKIAWNANKRGFAAVGSNTAAMFPCFLTGTEFIKIGSGFRAKPNLRLEAFWEDHKEAPPYICIGNGVCLNYDVHIGAVRGIVIGDDVLVGSHVLITDHNHGDSTMEMLRMKPLERPHITKGEVTIGNSVWIGENAAILAGSRIGNNCIVGADTVVNGEVPDFCIAVGNPMRIIRRDEKSEQGTR